MLIQRTVAASVPAKYFNMCCGIIRRKIPEEYW